MGEVIELYTETKSASDSEGGFAENGEQNRQRPCRKLVALDRRDAIGDSKHTSVDPERALVARHAPCKITSVKPQRRFGPAAGAGFRIDPESQEEELRMKAHLSAFCREAKVLAGCMAVLGIAIGCGKIDDVRQNVSAAINGPYHTLSGGNGVYITFHHHATDAMTGFYNYCKSGGKSDEICGRDTLRVARGEIEKKMRGAALEVWNGTYSVFGYHPHIGKGFRDEEGGDFATAVRDLANRGHRCLRIHWKPTGTNWTTVSDSLAECKVGAKLL